VVIDPEEFGGNQTYHLINAAIAPRPVAWVSTLGADGVPNLAPHSYTTVFSTDPPVLGFVSTGRKDSLNNAEATGEFVLNIGSIDLLEAMNLTSANFPAVEDEFAAAGLTKVASHLVRPPRVGEAPIAFETRVIEGGIIAIGNGNLILGQVLRIHVAADIWRNGRIDPTLFKPILRMSGSGYAELGPLLHLPRPTYQDVLDGTVGKLERRPS
jgi:flavin reductase (DIM6/NTAB) family NADH-FMN oxidoreductase RutF